MLPEDALCARANPEQTAKNEQALCGNPGNRGGELKSVGEKTEARLSNRVTAVLSPGGMLVTENKHKKEVDINHFHAFHARAHVGVLKATAQQNGICLVGKLSSYSGCLQAEGIHAAIQLRTTRRHGCERQWN